MKVRSDEISPRLHEFGGKDQYPVLIVPGHINDAYTFFNFKILINHARRSCSTSGKSIAWVVS